MLYLKTQAAISNKLVFEAFSLKNCLIVPDDNGGLPLLADHNIWSARAGAGPQPAAAKQERLIVTN